MPLHRHRKSQVRFTILSILILTAGFLMISSILKMFVSEAEAKASESICKASVVLRERTYNEIGVAGVELASLSSPLLCKTVDKRLPEDKDATKSHIKKEFANMMASCYNQFGEGLIKDPFKQGNPFINNCFVCYTVSLRETSNFNKDDKISTEEMLQYLFETPYKIRSIGQNCEKNQGVCNQKNPDTGIYMQYNKWACDSGRCFVRKDQFYSYGQYIQSFGGEGKIVLGTDIKPGEIYAMSFGSPTEGECDICDDIGIGAGAAAAFGTIVFTASGPIGLAAGAIAGVATYAGAKLSTEAGAFTIRDLFFERKFPTIYLTTFKQIQEGSLCNVVEDIQET